jgi:dihydroxyacid dehydratase/phosphogluconate dehydratase
MSQLADCAPTHAPAVRDREARDHRPEPFARHARLWALLGALGYAGAVIDPSGILASHRFRRLEEQEQRDGRR